MYHGGGEPRFEMKGFFPGTYRLEADVDGFEEYVIEKFILQEDQVLDLGEIPLQPCGVIDLTITDNKGNPLESFDLYCNGKEHIDSLRRSLGEGSFRCNKLPLGNVRLLFMAENHEEKEITLDLDPGRIEKVRVELRSF